MRMLLFVGLSAACIAFSCSLVPRDAENSGSTSISRSPETLALCSDYPFMVALAESQLGYHEANLRNAQDAVTVSRPIEDFVDIRNWFSGLVATMRQNQIQICGADLEPFGRVRREMQSLEGNGICTGVLRVVQTSLALNLDWSRVSDEMSNVVEAMAEKYVDYCDNDAAG